MSKSKRSHAAAATPGVARLVDASVEFVVRSYPHDEAISGELGYGVEAARALGVEPDRVFKTLMVVAGRRHVLGVIPVSRSLDLKATARALREKQVAMAPAAVAERVSGSVVGGISPLGGRTALDVIVDETAAAYDTILVSAGKRGVDVELSPADLLRVTGGRMAPIARRP